MPVRKTGDGAQPKPHCHGHRERLRKRFQDAGAQALADYELLELVLLRAIPVRDGTAFDLNRDQVPPSATARRSVRCRRYAISAATTRILRIPAMAAFA